MEHRESSGFIAHLHLKNLSSCIIEEYGVELVPFVVATPLLAELGKIH